MDAERYDSAIMNIKFALQFERDNEVFQEWLEKGQNSCKKKPLKEESLQDSSLAKSVRRESTNGLLENPFRFPSTKSAIQR